ncbi:DUF2752 domain-containing protein [Aquimarina sp. 2201CG5-10]|uniref:DUF2752 domain-containing protein n=1 Tax=Aquimarina callyspongiae TaxID=3098150 RepID=UPI002AB3CA92|nr:DUF2752 domain-containing protein [Aquimarina sp. 2201CG5-10]MDY8138972.1 DUF2752 domain-containing protein [Aquimarina sp. 2201CG5-10]
MGEIISFLETHLLQCPTKKLIGIDCLGCGMQRSFVLLLKGQVSASFIMYPALIPMLFMLLFLLAHIIFEFKKGATILKYFYILNIILIITNYIIKI